MEKIKTIRFLDGYKIGIHFSDDFFCEIDFSEFIDKGISLQLKEYDYFRKAYIDDNGSLTWPNGYDFDSGFLREIAEKKLTYLA